MSGSEDDGRQEEDPFWEIALNHDGSGKLNNALDNHNGDEGDSDTDEDDPVIGGKAKTYHLPNSSISLELAPLASDDGVWSPVGDHAWYSSALLTCLILQSTVLLVNSDDCTSTTSTTTGENNPDALGNFAGGIGMDDFEAGKEIRILELGSGAIGLPGISFAAALSQQQERFPSWTVSLTDNDESLLKQLQTNVHSNIAPNKLFLSSTDNGAELTETRRVNVEYLDWDIGNYGDDNDNDDDDDENKSESDIVMVQGSNPHRLLAADLVIGSELVYTQETAIALVKILLALLDRNPAVKIWIVQVTDRYGWKEIVIPALESKKTVRIENIPLSYDIHEIASTMIPMGGALDRYAFGAFCISNEDNNNNNNNSADKSA